MSTPRGLGRSAATVVAVWLVGVVVLGLVIAHLVGGTAAGTAAATATTAVTATGTAAATAAAADPVGRIEQVPAGQRVPAAPIVGELLGGGRYDAAAFAGHIRVVNAWGSWCTPCRQELPALRRLALATYASPVDFLGLDEEETSMAAGEAMARLYHLPYRSIYDEDKSMYDALAPLIAPSGVPGTVVIDAQGRVAATVIGAVNEAALGVYLRQLAAQPS